MLQAFPAITPFEGLASGVAAIVRHLPAGSPAIFYCIHSIAEKANKLCSVEFIQDGHMSMKWQGESEPCKNLLELLLRLLSLVDIQVSSLTLLFVMPCSKIILSETIYSVIICLGACTTFERHLSLVLSFDRKLLLSQW